MAKVLTRNSNFYSTKMPLALLDRLKLYFTLNNKLICIVQFVWVDDKQIFIFLYPFIVAAKQQLQDEASREKCRRFHMQQRCSFGETCIYSHLTDADILELKRRGEWLIFTVILKKKSVQRNYFQQ